MVAGIERIGPEADPAGGPQRVLLVGVGADPLVDEAVVDLLEGDLDMGRRIGAGIAGQALAPVRMHPLEMHRVDGILLALEPVAGNLGKHHLDEAVRPGEGLPVRHQRLRLRPQIGPEQAGLRLHRIGDHPHLVLEARAGVDHLLVGLLQAGAVPVEQPAVIVAAQAAFLDIAIGQVGIAMRAAPLHQAVAAAQVLVQDQVLAQQPHRLHRIVVQLRDRRDRLPVAAHQLAHRRALADARQQFILGLAQHGASSLDPVASCPGMRRLVSRMPNLIRLF